MGACAESWRHSVNEQSGHQRLLLLLCGSTCVQLSYSVQDIHAQEIPVPT